MIVNKKTFKELRKEGGGLMKTILCCWSNYAYGYREIEKSFAHFYVMNNGILADISSEKNIFISYNDIKDVKVKNSDLIITASEEDEQREIAFSIDNPKNLKLAYKNICEKSYIAEEVISEKELHRKKKTKESIKVEKEYKKDHICEFINKSGLPLTPGAVVKIENLEDKIVLTSTGTNFIQEIKYTDIVNVANREYTEDNSKNKSVIGRAVVGGLLTGGIGAIIGGMSGIGQKKDIKKISAFEIIYLKNGIQTSIILEQKQFEFNANKIMNSILEKANSSSKEQVDIQHVTVSSVDIADQLKKLSDLRDSGVISEEDFKKGKEKILE